MFLQCRGNQESGWNMDLDIIMKAWCWTGRVVTSVTIIYSQNYIYLLPKFYFINIRLPSSTRVQLRSISLRLLALILCSNCSITFNKVMKPTGFHTVNLLFANQEHPFCLQNMLHGWSKHFTSRYDPSTPFPNPTTPKKWLVFGLIW